MEKLTPRLVEESTPAVINSDLTLAELEKGEKMSNSSLANPKPLLRFSMVNVSPALVPDF